MKRVLVTGISGFTGKHFQQYIFRNRLHENVHFYGIDIVTDPCESFIGSYTVDLRDKKESKRALCHVKPDYIIHLAGTFTASDFDELLDTNANSTKNILQVSVEAKIACQKILIIGSAAEYGTPDSLPVGENSALKPISAYGVSKAIQTFYALYFHNTYKIPCVIARPFNIIGKGVSTSLSVGSFMDQIEQAVSGDVIHVGNIDTRRDFIHISDAVDAYWKLLINGSQGEIYNVCSGKAVSIREILNRLIDRSGKDLKIEVDPNRIKKNDIESVFGDNRKIQDHVGWECRHEEYKIIY